MFTVQVTVSESAEPTLTALKTCLANKFVLLFPRFAALLSKIPASVIACVVEFVIVPAPNVAVSFTLPCVAALISVVAITLCPF